MHAYETQLPLTPLHPPPHTIAVLNMPESYWDGEISVVFCAIATHRGSDALTTAGTAIATAVLAGSNFVLAVIGFSASQASTSKCAAETLYINVVNQGAACRCRDGCLQPKRNSSFHRLLHTLCSSFRHSFGVSGHLSSTECPEVVGKDSESDVAYSGRFDPGLVEDICMMLRNWPCS